MDKQATQEALALVAEDDPILRQKAEPVDIQDARMLSIDRMRELYWELNGLGLSAPQVGIPLRFFVAEIKGLPVAINPSIVSASAGMISKPERCLTWPGRTRYKKRHRWILAQYTDRSGKLRTKKLEGLEARIFQHELDHLDGICLF